jgi:hypothetical protein
VRRLRSAVALAALAVISTDGCALLSRGTPLRPRYFDPSPSEPLQAGGAAAGATEPQPCALQLGEISAADDLGESIAFRSSPHQVGYYETRRWRISPDNYLRRALEHRIFDEGRCRRLWSSAGLILDARLLAFEEVRGPPHKARVAVHLIVSDERAVLHEETIDWTRSCREGEDDAAFEGFVRAIAQALDDVVARVVEVVLSTAPAVVPKSPG